MGLVFSDSAHTWLFEYDARHKLVQRFLWTVSMTYRPWRFWREVSMTDRIYGKRLGLMLAVLVAVLFALRSVEAIWDYQNWKSIPWWGGPPMARREMLNWFFNNLLLGAGMMDWKGPEVPFFRGILGGAFLWSALFLVSFRLLPVSIRRAKVAKGHLLRVSLYSYIPVVPFLILGSISALGAVGLDQFTQVSTNTFWDFQRFCNAVIPTFGWFIWQIVCWSIACRYYLKLPHAPGIAILLPSCLAWLLW